MGVFRNENAAALLFRDTQQQGKRSKSANAVFFAGKRRKQPKLRLHTFRRNAPSSAGNDSGQQKARPAA
jgi:hypothetical protein